MGTRSRRRSRRSSAAPRSLNRYPDGGAFHLRNAIAARHDVEPANVITGAGADAIIGHLSVAALDPGDEVVTAWPSFISYVLDALKVGAVPRKVPLVDDHYDLDALLDAIGPKTKLVYVATPNNPTGTMTTRDELDSYFERVPEHVLTVLDQAYFEYIDRPDYPDGVAEYLARGHRVLVLRTFSKIYGLAGLRVGYGVGPPDVIQAIGKTRRAFDVGTQAQVAALASIDGAAELAERRRLTAEGAPRSSGRSASTGSSRPGRRSGTSSSSRSARTRPRSSTRCSARARSSARWARSALRGRCGSRSGRRTRTHSSPRRSPPSGRRRPKARLSWGPSRAPEPAFPMRTTLKRGIGRGAGVNGNGRAVLPPGALSPITIYRQPEPPPRSRWAFVRTALAWAGVAPPRRDRLGRRRRLSLVPPERRRRRRLDARRQDRGEAARRRACPASPRRRS